MYKYIAVVLALVACIAAKPVIVTPLSYGAAAYASAGTSQLDIRNNYNGGYTTSLGYTAPLQTRVAAPVSPFAYTAPLAKYAAPAVAGPFGYAAPVAKYTSPIAAYGSPYTSPIAAAAYGSPYTAAAYTPYAAPYNTAYGSPYATAYGSPYTVAGPAAAPLYL